MLEVGNTVAPFKATLQSGDTIELPQKGQKYVFYFYPKDNTPGCTLEAQTIRDEMTPITKKGYEVYGISPDSTTSHQKFIDKQTLNFPLIADTDHQIAEQFGVWQKKSMYGKEYMGIVRSTFVVDQNAKITAVIDKVNTKDAGNQLLEHLD